MNYILQTERLRLREFTLKDTDFIIELVNTPGWLQFIGDRNIKTQEQAKAYLENGPLKSYLENKFGLWMVEYKHSAPIGMCGILKRPNLDTPDIGFAFLPAFTGNGCAFEIATATVLYAHRVLRILTLSAITQPDNERSIKLLEKLGFEFKEVLESAADVKELHRYQIYFHP